MKNIITVIFSCAIVLLPLITRADDTNNRVIDNSYQQLTTRTLQNFRQDLETLSQLQSSDCHLKSRLWVQLLNQIDSTRDLRFDFNAPENIFSSTVVVPLNPAIPKSASYPSGITPEAIQEPEIRKPYEEAIKKNHEKYLRYDFELQLQRLDDECNHYAVEYFKSAYSSNPESANDLKSTLALITDAKQKEKLNSALADIVKNAAH